MSLLCLPQLLGIILLSAIYEPFSLDGETLENPIIQPNGAYPNHCKVHFPETTHRLKLLFNGGVWLDGLLPLTPERLDLVQVLDAEVNQISSNIALGLADLGPAPSMFHYDFTYKRFLY